MKIAFLSRHSLRSTEDWELGGQDLVFKGLTRNHQLVSSEREREKVFLSQGKGKRKGLFSLREKEKESAFLSLVVPPLILAQQQTTIFAFGLVKKSINRRRIRKDFLSSQAYLPIFRTNNTLRDGHSTQALLSPQQPVATMSRFSSDDNFSLPFHCLTFSFSHASFLHSLFKSPLHAQSEILRVQSSHSGREREKCEGMRR